MNMNLSVGRESDTACLFRPHTRQAARSSLLNRDLALHTDMKDNASGVTYIQAARQMLGLWKRNVPVAQVGPIPYWENMWPGAAGKGLTATQAIYSVFRAYNVDTSAVTYDIDINALRRAVNLGPFPCSTNRSRLITPILPTAEELPRHAMDGAQEAGQRCAV